MDKNRGINVLDTKMKFLLRDIWPEVARYGSKFFAGKEAISYKGNGKFLFLILRGNVLQYKIARNNEIIGLNILKPGDILGNLFQTTDEISQAIDDLWAMEIPKSDIHAGKCVMLSRYIIENKEKQAQRLKENIERLHFYNDAAGKVLKVLKYFKSEGCYLDAEGRITANCEEVGAFACLRRETISRAYGELKKTKKIRKKNLRIELLKKA